MRILIANSSPDPIYEQIARQIKAQIIAGDLREGEPLPSIRRLAQDLQISVITSKRAYDELEAEGFIDTVAGKGHLRRRPERRVPPREAHEGGRGEAGGGGVGGAAHGARLPATERNAPSALRGGGMTPDHALELRGVTQALPRVHAPRTCRSPCRAGTSCGLDRPQRRGQDDDHQAHHEPGAAGRGRDPGLRSRQPRRRSGREVADRVRVRRRPATGTTSTLDDAAPGPRPVLPGLERPDVRPAGRRVRAADAPGASRSSPAARR